MAQKRKHLPPSRIRYEQTHRVVSVRLGPEEHKSLQEIKERTGKTAAEVFKEALGTQARGTEEAFRKGHERGYLKAKEEYLVTVRCFLCGRDEEVVGPVKGVVQRALNTDVRWRHPECH